MQDATAGTELGRQFQCRSTAPSGQTIGYVREKVCGFAATIPVLSNCLYRYQAIGVILSENTAIVTQTLNERNKKKTASFAGHEHIPRITIVKTQKESGLAAISAVGLAHREVAPKHLGGPTHEGELGAWSPGKILPPLASITPGAAQPMPVRIKIDKILNNSNFQVQAGQNMIHIPFCLRNCCLGSREVGTFPH